MPSQRGAAYNCVVSHMNTLHCALTKGCCIQLCGVSHEHMALCPHKGVLHTTVQCLTRTHGTVPSQRGVAYNCVVFHMNTWHCALTKGCCIQLCGVSHEHMALCPHKGVLHTTVQCLTRTHGTVPSQRGVAYNCVVFHMNTWHCALTKGCCIQLCGVSHEHMALCPHKGVLHTTVWCLT